MDELKQRLAELGLDPSTTSSLCLLSPAGRESEEANEILLWLTEALKVITQDRDLEAAKALEDNAECDECYDDGELETILDERFQQLSVQYDTLSRLEVPPARVSEDRYRWPQKEKSLQCQEAAHKFRDALQDFLSVTKTFRPTDMNDKQINEYFTREEEFTRSVKGWILKNLADMPSKREAKVASRQATVILLSKTLLPGEEKLLNSEMELSEKKSVDSQDFNEERFAEAKKELENLNKSVIPVLRDGYELLETLPAVVADCEEEAEEMACSAVVLEQGVSFMMEQLSRCFLFELLLEEKALRGDMEVSILTHAMENELLASKREYEQWKMKAAKEAKKQEEEKNADTHEKIQSRPKSAENEALCVNDDETLQAASIDTCESNSATEPYKLLQPWVHKLEEMLFDGTGKLHTKQDNLEGILLEAEAKTRRLNDLVAQMEKRYHAEKEAVKCDGIRSFERNLWTDFFSNPEKLKEIVKGAQDALLD